jgi:hypothetical protein
VSEHRYLIIRSAVLSTVLLCVGVWGWSKLYDDYISYDANQTEWEVGWIRGRLFVYSANYLSDALPKSIPFRTREAIKPHIEVCRRGCRGDPRLPVIEINVRRAT